ncbi:hypothetical protein CORC01_00075 [Colletotrichum orchidophilum]|uniref:Uncharacterized protein n=1 Tax=Colletotrichum orchidophilum TaxID=1209926 RepID=A0A1G4BT49_9PEZI|nr:uncharacterized protein CORC01_00075 [Colletotrichum orchidophilum]OHF04604.1 hypothetical protein CORC01_00075 [Colletotrichum orchidophilum]
MTRHGLNITRLVDNLLVVLNDVKVRETVLDATYHDTQDPWWIFSPWGSPVRATTKPCTPMSWTRRPSSESAYPADHLSQILCIVYSKDWATAKLKHSGKLVNAQKTRELDVNIEVILELDLEACKNNGNISGISSMRKPTNKDPISSSDICQGLMLLLIAPADDDEAKDGRSFLAHGYYL